MSCCFPLRVRADSVSRTIFYQEGLTSYYTEDEEREVAPGEILITHGSAARGYEYPLIKFVVIAESDIFGQERKKKKKRKRYEGSKISSFTELSVGDFDCP